jgi:excisionase family DNA binding protein
MALDLERFVTTEDAASTLRVHPNTLRNWAKDNRIPFIRVGGRYRFDINEIIKRSTGENTVDQAKTGSV